MQRKSESGMKKKFLAWVNVLLGAASLTLVGCHSTKQAVVNGGPEEKYGIPEPEMVAMYGVPSPVVEQQNEPTIEPIPESERPNRPEPPVCKYGIPMPREDRY